LNAGKWLQVSLYEKAFRTLTKGGLSAPTIFIFEANMETYHIFSKAGKTYSGFSLEAKVEVDWIQSYRKSPFYDANPNASMNASVKGFKEKYF